MDDLFAEARLKIKWANQHIAHLGDMLHAFSKTDFYIIAVEKDEDSDGHVWRFRQIRSPWEAPLIIGDAIHNIRSALDIAYFSLVKQVGDPTDWTQFKFFSDRNHLVTSLRGGVLKRAPDIVDRLADEIRPYRAKDNSILALHDLDIADKHMLVLPTLPVTKVRLRKVVINGGIVSGMRFEDLTVTVREGGIADLVGFGFDGSADMKIDIQGDRQATFTVLFGKGQPLENDPVIPTLTQLSQLVSTIIDKFAKWVAERKTI
jgi:hypothetical protein